MVTKHYCNCGGLGGYLLKECELVCQTCGGLSPKARLSGETFVRLGDKQLLCPKCGEIIQEERPEIKIGQEPENKMAEPPEVKRIVPHGVNKVGRPKRR